MDKFFTTVSKYILYVPIAIVVLAMVFKFGQTSRTLGEVVDKITPTPTAAPQKPNIDLNGPYQCQYKNKDGEYKAYIKNKKVLVNVVTKNDTDKYYFDGDCLYADGVKKMCSLSPYVSMVEGVLGGNLSMVNSMAGDYLNSDVDVGEILKTCVKKDFSDAVFQ